MVATNALTNNTNVSAYNMYNNFSNGSMATDFFGSQFFGGSIMPTATAPVAQTTTPTNNASAILQAYKAQATAATPYAVNQSGTVDPQAYINMNNMINYYANQVPLLYNTSSFMQNDLFAQQIPSNFYQTNPQAARVNYAA